MNTEELKKKLNRSLIFECVSIVVPSFYTLLWLYVLLLLVLQELANKQ
jgi:hypothetical protein